MLEEKNRPRLRELKDVLEYSRDENHTITASLAIVEAVDDLADRLVDAIYGFRQDKK